MYQQLPENISDHWDSEESLAEAFIGDATVLSSPFSLRLRHLSIEIFSNSNDLLQQLQQYYQDFQRSDEPPSNSETLRIIAIDRPEILTKLSWQDWKNQEGMIKGKDAFLDTRFGRMIKKRRTGMTFLQPFRTIPSQAEPITEPAPVTMAGLAAGNCLTHISQVINFINNQYMNLLQQQGALIAHAAAVSYHNQGLAIAGFSGGGKSTASLHIMEHPDLQWVSNDRLFLQPKPNTLGITAYGIPKHPRVNPGTLLNNLRLRPLLSESEQERIGQLSKNELWKLEDKYDVIMSEVYGKGKVVNSTELKHVIILNWNLSDSTPTALTPIDEAKDLTPLLPAISKSPGPFYLNSEGTFLQQDQTPNSQKYLDALKNVQLYKATGRIDFTQLTQLSHELLTSQC